MKCLLGSVLLALFTGCSQSSPTAYRYHAFNEVPAVVKRPLPVVQPTPQTANAPTNSTALPVDPQFDWKGQIGDILAPPTGLIASLNIPDQVFTVTIPRADLDLRIDGMPVPITAGLASVFQFYRCSCGKMSVLGEFIVIDYEANDVVDALRQGAAIRVASISPIAIGDRPHLLSIRFHGEGDAMALAKVVKEAMRWTGEARMKPAK